MSTCRSSSPVPRMDERPAYVFITVTATGKRKRWQVVWRPKGHPDLDGATGRIDGPYVKGKRLYLQEGQTLDDLFDTFLHEATHAAGWNLSEDWVHSFANDVTEGLRKIGFKLAVDDE